MVGTHVFRGQLSDRCFVGVEWECAAGSFRGGYDCCCFQQWLYSVVHSAARCCGFPFGNVCLLRTSTLRVHQQQQQYPASLSPPSLLTRTRPRPRRRRVTPPCAAVPSPPPSLSSRCLLCPSHGAGASNILPSQSTRSDVCAPSDLPQVSQVGLRCITMGDCRGCECRDGGSEGVLHFGCRWRGGRG